MIGVGAAGAGSPDAGVASNANADAVAIIIARPRAGMTKPRGAGVPGIASRHIAITARRAIRIIRLTTGGNEAKLAGRLLQPRAFKIRTRPPGAAKTLVQA